jgi:murein L,D-transpeptidase YafK
MGKIILAGFLLFMDLACQAADTEDKNLNSGAAE